MNSSDWNKHGHTRDPNYTNVILHVVWDDDLPLRDIPTLELKGKVSKQLLDRFEGLIQSTGFIPCGGLAVSVRDITWTAWKTRLLAERLTRKAISIRTCLDATHQHW